MNAFSGVHTACPACETKAHQDATYDETTGTPRMHRRCVVCAYTWWEKPAAASADEPTGKSLTELISTFLTQDDLRKIIRLFGEQK